MKTLLKRGLWLIVTVCIAIFGVSFFVNNVLADEDVTAPTITSFAATPTSFDTSSGNATISVTVGLADDQTGVSYTGDGESAWKSMIRLQSVSKNDQYYDCWPTLTSGDKNSGVFSCNFTVPQWSASGEWKFIVMAGDIIGNIADYDSKQFNEDTELYVNEITAQVSQASGTILTNVATSEDNIAPAITSFAATPTSFDISSGNATISVTVGLADDQTGVSYTGDGESAWKSMIRITPLISSQYQDCWPTLVSGDKNSGIFTCNFDLSSGSKEGVWTVTVMVGDSIGNKTDYTSDLLAQVPSATGMTLTNIATANSVEIERNWTINGNGNAVTFPSGTIVTKNDGGNFAFYRLTAQDYDITSLAKGNLDGDVVGKLMLGISGMNLSFSQPVAFNLNVGDEYNGKILKIKSLGEGQNEWVNEDTCVVNGGICNFTANHATYFAATATDLVSDSQLFDDVRVSFPKKYVRSGKTSLEKIKIEFDNISNATKFKISTHSDFSGGSWESISDSKTIKFKDNSKKIKRRYYIKFKSADGSESDVFKKTVTVTPNPVRAIKNSKSIVHRGDIFTQSGKNFSKKSTVLVFFSKLEGGFNKAVPVTTDSKGSFAIQYNYSKQSGTYNWYALDTKTGKKSKTIHYIVK